VLSADGDALGLWNVVNSHLSAFTAPERVPRCDTLHYRNLGRVAEHQRVTVTISVGAIVDKTGERRSNCSGAKSDQKYSG
jgi:hypothetical protein